MATIQENEMKTSLIGFTGMNMPYRYAQALLLFTKNTRLQMKGASMNDIMNWPESEIETQLDYMSNTIPSSWEFIDYIFVFEDVTRAFTHQLVRTRAGSYAQQTMRVLNVDGFTYETGPSIQESEDLEPAYQQSMISINEMYNWLIENGAEIEDARGILPTNIHTNIVAKFNLRTVAELATKRSSPRTQGEYRKVLDSMLECVIEVHPWAHRFLRNRKIEAAAKLDEFINEIFLEKDSQKRIDLLKQVDILRQS